MAAHEHSFTLLLERYVRPGMRVLEVGAAKCWAAQHLIPRGVEYVARGHPRRRRRSGSAAAPSTSAAPGRSRGCRPTESTCRSRTRRSTSSYCVAALHHALDRGQMVRELARVARRGGVGRRAERGDARAAQAA